jgi:hypothetical protein
MLVALFLALIGLGAPQNATSSSVVPMDFRQIVELADLAFAGDVESVIGEWTPSHSMIITKVRFANVSMAIGDIPKIGLVLSLRGGQVGSARVIVPGQPEFKLGERYVVLCRGEPNPNHSRYMPVVGLWQGVFSVEKGGAVRSYDGMPIVSMEGDRLVAVSEKREPSEVNRDIATSTKVGSPAPFDSIYSDARDRTMIPVPSTPPLHGMATKADVPRVKGSSPSRRVRYSREPVRILPRLSDPGTRMREGEFLAVIRRLSNRR